MDKQWREHLIAVVSGCSHCSPIVWGPSLSEYSRPVWHVLVLMLVNYNQHQAGAEDDVGERRQLTLRMTERRKPNSLPMTIAWVGGLVCWKQTQVELSGLHCVTNMSLPPGSERLSKAISLINLSLCRGVCALPPSECRMGAQG